MIFKTTVSGEEDIFDTEQLHLLNDILPRLTITSMNENTYSYEVRLQHNEDKIRLCTLMGTEYVYSEMPMQDFVDNISIESRQTTPISSVSAYMSLTKELKNIIVEKLSDEGDLFLNNKYSCLGFIISNGDKVATFDNFTIKNQLCLKLDNIINTLNLSNLDLDSIELYIDKKYGFTSDISNFRDGNIVELDYPLGETINIPKEVLESKKMTECIDREEFITERKKLLKIESSIETYSLDDLDDLF